MDTPAADAGVSLDDVRSSDPEVESSKVDLVVEVSTNGDMGGDLATAGEVLTRLELDLACASEKLINLNLLMMHVATREGDFESFASSRGDALDYSAEKALEFDLLSSVLDSEVTDVDNLITNLNVDVSNVRDTISPYANVGEKFVGMDEKLCDCEKSLKQLKDQVSEIREQGTRFHRTLSCLNREENGNGAREEDVHFFSINLQTVEQQRHILRMLEKSLARELDLEKKVAESRQAEEELNHSLLIAEQEAYFMEEEAMGVYERWFGAENATEVFMGTTKELLGRIQVLQFNLNGFMKREAELSSKLEKSADLLESKESALQKFNSSSSKLNEFLVAQTEKLKDSLTEAETKLILANSEVFTLGEKVCSLEKQLKESEVQNASSSEISDMENVIDNLNSRAESAEARCTLLTEANAELNEELGKLKDVYEKVELLERQLRESDLKLQHAVASADASQEKQNMLYSTISDMGNLIEDLKSKLSKEESRADSAEDKCIILSESNALLNEELNFLRSRLESSEASLNQAEEIKLSAAMDIGFRSKVIADLVMQLAIERERLHKQILSLALENRSLVLKLQKTKNEPVVATEHRNKGSGERILIPEQEISSTGFEVDNTLGNALVGKTKMGSGDSAFDLEGTRRIDARLLDLKHLIMAVLILLSSAAMYFFLAEKSTL